MRGYSQESESEYYTLALYNLTMTPQQILNTLALVRAAILAYQPVNPPYAGSVKAYYSSAGDDLDRVTEKIQLAMIMDTGGFLPPPAGFGV